MWKQTRFLVTDPSSVGEIRRHAVGLCEELDFDEVTSSQVSTVITELATNIVKHANRGEVFLTLSPHSIDIIAVDRGPGMDNIQECFTDGFSTQGTAGNGLGAIKRASHFFDFFTSTKGSVFYAGFTNLKEESKYRVGAINQPYKDETLSGDSWSFCRDGKNLRVILADGLGHGILAHEASSLAINVFENSHAKPLVDSLNQLHLALRPTRGAAVSIAELNPSKSILNFCGVGNVSGNIYSSTSVKRCISHSGTVGIQVRKVQPFSYPLEDEFTLIMFSDGLSSHFELKDYPGLQLKHAFVIAGILYRDFGKTSDDSTVVVVQGVE